MPEIGIAASEVASRAHEIRRDAYGTPRVLAATEADGFFGLGLAQGETALLEILFLKLQVAGRLAEALGPDCAPSDARHRRLGFDQVDAAPLSPALRADVLRPFADGVNAAAARQAARLPAWAARALPYTEHDVLAIAGLYVFVIATANDRYGVGGFVAASPWHGARAARGQLGSNVLAIGPRRSAEGWPMLLANPHIDLQEPFLFQEYGLEAGATRLHGFGFLGLPLPLFGFTPHLAWGVAVNQAQSHRRLSATDPFALDWSGRGDARLLEQLWRMAKARDVGELRSALELGQFPNYSLVAIDARGGLLHAELAGAAIPFPFVLDPEAGYSHASNGKPWFHARPAGFAVCGVPERFAPCAGEGKDKPEPRARFVLEALEKARPSFAEMQAVLLDSRVGAAAWDRPRHALLDGWDGRAAVDSRAAALYHAYAFARARGRESEAALAEAELDLRRRFGRIDPRWGEAHVLRRAPSPLRPGAAVEFGIPGSWQDLGALNAFQVEPRPWVRREAPDPRWVADFGGGAMLAVAFAPGGPIALSALPFGQGQAPDSPHFVDQGRALIAQGRLKRVAFGQPPLGLKQSP